MTVNEKPMFHDTIGEGDAPLRIKIAAARHNIDALADKLKEIVREQEGLAEQLAKGDLMETGLVAQHAKLRKLREAVVLKQTMMEAYLVQLERR